jgi:hypothetical protein
MSRLRIAPIVEGHAEYECIRILLDRIWREMVGGEYLEVLRPVRFPRSTLIGEHGLQRAVGLARLGLSQSRRFDDPELILVLVDAEGPDGCPVRLGPMLRRWAEVEAAPINLACVIANVAYETWFVAAAESLGSYLSLGESEAVPDDPEGLGLGVNWVRSRFRHAKYDKTRDAPGMTKAMNLDHCLQRCRSFRKLRDELRRMRPED